MKRLTTLTVGLLYWWIAVTIFNMPLSPSKICHYLIESIFMMNS
ncbi:hypothetical protein [Furfurilactobacillus rossiae]|nr:hypothetical protein [Furfurilactobacillus rossiae]QLE61518.1 hypothetical protein LROSRS0_1472 [Furfurilactobacillus rossiae]